MNFIKRRLRLKSNHNIKLKDKVILIIMLVLFVTGFLIILFNNKVRPLLFYYAEQQMINEMTYLANSIVKEHYIDKDNYGEMMHTSTNVAGEIISIDFDSTEINKILNEITNNLIIDLKKIEDTTFLNNNTIYYIPFGIVTGLPSSNWIGPQIPIKVMTSGSIETKINTLLKEYGINNALLEMNIEININTRILLPYTDKKIKIDLEVPIIKKIIQGKIPAVYGGLYSTSSNILNESIE